MTKYSYAHKVSSWNKLIWKNSTWLKLPRTGGNHLRTLVRTSSLRHTVIFSVLVFVTLWWSVCAVFSSSVFVTTVMVGVHKNARDNVSTIYVLKYCTHLLIVRDRRDWNISLSLFYLRDLHGTTQRTLYAEWHSRKCLVVPIVGSYGTTIRSGYFMSPVQLFGGYLWDYSACPLIVLYII